MLYTCTCAVVIVFMELMLLLLQRRTLEPRDVSSDRQRSSSHVPLFHTRPSLWSSGSVSSSLSPLKGGRPDRYWPAKNCLCSVVVQISLGPSSGPAQHQTQMAAG